MKNVTDEFDAHANLIETLNNPSNPSDKELEAACDALVRLSQVEKAPRYQACDIFGRGWYDITKEDYDICKNRRDIAVRVVPYVKCGHSVPKPLEDDGAMSDVKPATDEQIDIRLERPHELTDFELALIARIRDNIQRDS